MKKLLVVMFGLLVLTVGLTAQTGLFPVCYEIGNNMPGSVFFKCHLMVYTPGKTENGYGVITQATNPPLHIESNLQGDFSYMTVMPKDTHILVVITGYPITGPVGSPNVKLRMALSEDWKSGTANYQYLDAKGNWVNIENVPVKVVDCWPK